MRILSSGREPMDLGINRAKRVARAADRRDQLAVLREIGPGHPRQHSHHQRLVRERHAYYRNAYDEAKRARAASADLAHARDVQRAVP